MEQRRWRGRRSYRVGAPHGRWHTRQGPERPQPPSKPPRAALQPSLPTLPCFEGRPGPAPCELTGSGAQRRLFLAASLPRTRSVQAAPGSLRPTRGEWMGEELKVLSQLPCSQDTVIGALILDYFSRELWDRHCLPLGTQFPMS